MSSIDLNAGPDDGPPKIRRLNRLPIFIFIALAVIFFALIIWGLSQRGLIRRPEQPDRSQSQPASDFADEIKRGIGDGLIDEPRSDPVMAPPTIEPGVKEELASNPFQPSPRQEEAQHTALEPEADWRERLLRDQEEALMREQHRQQLAAIQAQANARNSPIAVDVRNLDEAQSAGRQQVHGQRPGPFSSEGMDDFYAALMRPGTGVRAGARDQNNQTGKRAFLDQKAADLGYLPNQVVAQSSPNELKRGSVIPATLLSGINSDLPGRITAQVRQNVYDSATGHRLLIPQGAKLFGRYDAEVSFGQKRVLVVWTDIIFPNGSTLQIGGMAGVDSQGNGGLRDKVNNHFWRTFGSAVLVAAIGTGVDMALPESRTNAFGVSQSHPEDAARRNFAETFGRVADKTIDRNLNVQPTLEIRPGYNFNVLVDQDIVFPGSFSTKEYP